MALVRSVILVDGENLVFRFQQMVKDGYAPRPDIIYDPELIVWHSQMFAMWGVDNFRVNYFISVIGGNDVLDSARNAIARIHSTQTGNYYQGCQLTPCVYKKPKKSQKSRLVDINMTVEAMRMAYSDQVDVVCVISGDGDFIEVYNDIKRRGKQVCVAALSNGLNSRVPSSVDRFFDLDHVLFTDTCRIQNREFYSALYDKIPKKTDRTEFE